MLTKTRAVVAALLGLLVLAATACQVPSGPAGRPPAPTPPVSATTVAPPDPVLVGAGDIANEGPGATATAALLDAIPGTVFTTGDNVYGSGTTAQYARWYEPTWGRHRWRTRPSPGNHDYQTAGAAGYFRYFGSAAGRPGQGYYSYDLGTWHIIALNSSIAAAAGSPQERWLRADLASHPAHCTLAYWHDPLFTSGSDHSPSTVVKPLYQALYDHGADVVLWGHNHQYERFAPQDPRGRRDLSHGLRAFVVGTGGASHYAFGPVRANSEARNGDTFGVLALTLHPDGYDWRFVPEAGRSYVDVGSGTCHS